MATYASLQCAVCIVVLHGKHVHLPVVYVIRYLCCFVWKPVGRILGRNGPLREAQTVVATGFCVAWSTAGALHLGGSTASSLASTCISNSGKALENLSPFYFNYHPSLVHWFPHLGWWGRVTKVMFYAPNSGVLHCEHFFLFCFVFSVSLKWISAWEGTCLFCTLKPDLTNSWLMGVSAAWWWPHSIEGGKHLRIADTG